MVAQRSSNSPPTPSATPAVVTDFMAWLADVPGVSASGHSGVAATLCPLTGWSQAQCAARLAQDLALPANLAALQRLVATLQRSGQAQVHVTGEHGRVNLLLAVRSIPGSMVATLAPLPSPPPDEIVADRLRLLHLLDRLPAFVCLLGPDHAIHYENHAFRQIFGQSGGRPCYEVIRGRSTPCTLCPPFDVFTSRTLCVSDWAPEDRPYAFRIFAYPFQDVDGSHLVLILGIDITTGVRAQKELSLSEERYRSITDHLTQGIAVLDATLRIKTANQRLREWFPNTARAGATLCQLLRDYCGDDNACCHACPALSSFHQQATLEKLMDLTVRGNRRHMRLLACPICSPDGGVASVIIMLEDETDRLRVERRLSVARRLEAMGTLAAGVAHEINQPLNAMRLYASGLEMLLERDPGVEPATVLERLGRILKEADRIRAIITHMRALAVQGDTTLHPTSIGTTLDDCMQLIGEQLRTHGVTLAVRLAPDLPLVLAAPVQLQQVFINLLVNAVHALDTTSQDARCITITATHEDNAVRVDVQDNGPGINDVADRIFDPFFSTKDPQKGMGLGLALVHTFVESWGGEVTATCVVPPGTGSVFTLVLRAATLAAQP